MSDEELREGEIDNLEPKRTKSDAERLAAWMRRGGFPSRLVKRPDGWHVVTRDRDRSRD